jgi:ATP-dependent DNA helicase RecG
VSKGLLPYHGLGSGIKCALDKWPEIDFLDDHDGCLFTATVHRRPLEDLNLVDELNKKLVKKPGLVLMIKGHPLFDTGRGGRDRW